MMKITNIESIEVFAQICAELAIKQVCFEADAGNLTITLNGGH